MKKLILISAFCFPLSVFVQAAQPAATSYSITAASATDRLLNNGTNLFTANVTNQLRALDTNYFKISAGGKITITPAIGNISGTMTTGFLPVATGTNQVSDSSLFQVSAAHVTLGPTNGSSFLALFTNNSTVYISATGSAGTTLSLSANSGVITFDANGAGFIMTGDSFYPTVAFSQIGILGAPFGHVYTTNLSLSAANYSDSGTALLRNGVPISETNWTATAQTLTALSGVTNFVLNSATMGVGGDKSFTFPTNLIIGASSSAPIHLKTLLNTYGSIESPYLILKSTGAGNEVDIQADNGNSTYVAGSTAFSPSTSNILDSATSLTPWRTNYSSKIVTEDTGNGQAAWKLGKKLAGLTLSLVTTNAVEVEIDGTTYKLALVQ